MLNPNQIQNSKLRNFIESHPEATMKEIIEYCKEMAINTIDSIVSQDNITFDFNSEEYKNMILGELIPFERETVHIKKYDDLQYDANSMLKVIFNQLEEILSLHGKDFSQKLKQILDQEFYEIMTIRPSTRYESSSNNVIASNLKEAQDMDDKYEIQRLDEKMRQNKQEILDRFKQLLSIDLKEYGMNLEGGRGNWSFVLNPKHQKGAQDKINALVIILNKSKDLFRHNLLNEILKQNDRIFEEFQKIRRDYMAIIEEAMIQTAKEDSKEKGQEGLSLEQVLIESNDKEKIADSTFRGDEIKDSQTEKTNSQVNNYWLGDMDAFSIVTIRPKDETIKMFAEKGISAEEASAYIWDRFVRIQKINEAFEANKITEEQKNQQLSYVDRIEELLFERLLAGRGIQESRFPVEIAVAKEIDYGIIGMDSKEFWKSCDAKIFSAVGILPDEKTVESLKRQGLNEAQIPEYVWDIFCRTSRVLTACENGRITEDEKNVQLGLVDKVKRRIFNELKSGKTIEEAREIAEVEVSYEIYDRENNLSSSTTNNLANTLSDYEQLVLEYIDQGKDLKDAMFLAKKDFLQRNQERLESNQVVARKSGLEDVIEDYRVKLSDVKKIAEIFSNERNPENKEKLNSDLIK